MRSRCRGKVRKGWCVERVKESGKERVSKGKEEEKKEEEERGKSGKVEE